MVRSAATDPPASPGDELVEWVDEHGEVLGIVTRRRMRTENLRHRSVSVVVLAGDGRLLVHRRSAEKDLLPGWWDVSVGGVMGVGEAPDDAAHRELYEEIGIEDARLEFLGVGRWDDAGSTEISHIYRTVHDGPFTYVDGEVAEARLVTATELAALMANERFLPACRGMVLPLVPGFLPR